MFLRLICQFLTIFFFYHQFSTTSHQIISFSCKIEFFYLCKQIMDGWSIWLCLVLSFHIPIVFVAKARFYLLCNTLKVCMIFLLWDFTKTLGEIHFSSILLNQSFVLWYAMLLWTLLMLFWIFSFFCTIGHNKSMILLTNCFSFSIDLNKMNIIWFYWEKMTLSLKKILTFLGHIEANFFPHSLFQKCNT